MLAVWGHRKINLATTAFYEQGVRLPILQIKAGRLFARTSFRYSHQTDRVARTGCVRRRQDRLLKNSTINDSDWKTRAAPECKMWQGRRDNQAIHPVTSSGSSVQTAIAPTCTSCEEPFIQTLAGIARVSLPRYPRSRRGRKSIKCLPPYLLHRAAIASSLESPASSLVSVASRTYPCT